MARALVFLAALAAVCEAVFVQRSVASTMAAASQSDSAASAEHALPFRSLATDPSGGYENITCSTGKQIFVPRAGVLLQYKNKKVMWCPNAKVGSSTIFNVISHMLGHKKVNNPHARRNGQQTSVFSLVAHGKGQELCDVDFSFTVLRNPWDRVRSAFLDKINRIIFVPDANGNGTLSNATFSQFLRAVEASEPRTMNVHWMPVSTRCLTAGPVTYKYAKIYKIERNFENSVVEAFTHLGVPRTRTEKVLRKVGERNRNSHDDHSVAARKESYQDEAIRELVRQVYADDIRMGGYSFRK